MIFVVENIGSVDGAVERCKRLQGDTGNFGQSYGADLKLFQDLSFRAQLTIGVESNIDSTLALFFNLPGEIEHPSVNRVIGVQVVGQDQGFAGVERPQPKIQHRERQGAECKVESPGGPCRCQDSVGLNSLKS